MFSKDELKSQLTLGEVQAVLDLQLRCEPKIYVAKLPIEIYVAKLPID